MITPDYNIIFKDTETQVWSNTRLIIEWSRQYLHYIVVQDSDTVLALKHYNWAPSADKSYVDLMKEVMESDDLLQNKFKTATVIYNVPENHLVPLEFYQESNNAELISLLHGDLNNGTVLCDNVEDTAINIIYKVPSDVHTYLQEQFAPDQFTHFYSLWIMWRSREELDMADCLYLVFHPNEFQIMLIKDNTLQLMQRYSYQVSEDVGYHLLNIYQQFELSVHDFPIGVSGMIAKDSDLYNELLKYFIKVETMPTPDSIKLPEEFSELPSHFFSPFLKIATCV